jgi:hypothetical protein
MAEIANVPKTMVTKKIEFMVTQNRGYQFEVGYESKMREKLKPT